MNIIKIFWKQSAIYGFGTFIVRAISFFLLPLYTNYFNQSEVGHIFLLFAFIAFCQIFYNHGLDSAFIKYYSTASDNKNQYGNTLLISLYITSIILSILLIVTSEFISNKILFFPNSVWIYYCAAILFFDSTANRILTLLRIQNRSWFFLLINVSNVLITLVANFIFVIYLNLGISGILLGTLLGSIFKWIPLLPTSVRLLFEGTFSLKVYKKCLKFGLPFLPASFFYIIMEISDRYFILIFSNASEVGIYSIGYKIGSIAMLIIIAFNLGWQPFYNRLGKSTNDIKTFSQIGSYFMFLIMSISVLIIIWTPIFMKIKISGTHIIGENFWAAYEIIPFILFSYIIYALYIIHMPPMYILEKQNWAPLFRGIGALTNITLNLLLIPYYSIKGAAVATLISYLVMTFFIYYKSNQWMKIPYKFNLIIKQFIITILAAIIFIQIDYNILNAITASILYFCALLLIGFKEIFTKVYKQLVADE